MTRKSGRCLASNNTVPIRGGGRAARAIALACALAAPAVHAGCSIQQTASNEIVIRTSVGGCDGAALRSSLTGALAAGGAVTAASAAVPQGAHGDNKRNSSQNALWRLANTNNGAVTSFTLPGR